MTFVIYQDRRKEYRWRLRARNGKIVADSAEGYGHKSKVTRMISKIIMGPHKIVEQSSPHI